MVGGIVKEVIQLRDATWVDCQGTGSESRETCAVYIVKSEGIEPGDKFWWQAGYAFWTPQLGNFSDFKLERIGFSGVARPTDDLIKKGVSRRATESND